jgi:hypothetical protein
MASFLSVLSSIGHIFGVAVGVEKSVAPIVGVIPVVGPIVNTIFGAITAAEGLVTSASQGAVKKSIVTAVVNAQHPGVSESALSTTIDQVVAAMNALSVALAGAPTAPAATPTT